MIAPDGSTGLGFEAALSYVRQGRRVYRRSKGWIHAAFVRFVIRALGLEATDWAVE